eukprot:TRINITY_DN68903_c0_g1_i1.p1 TRINITY_DN68903_c0_g1~~TRINITY_DN68903_c0_g1_i1.p1  ORF type:complete len:640 (+),score=95.08 TRINITY_DN68903_c0_g1_i1:92-1921(+)
MASTSAQSSLKGSERGNEYDRGAEELPTQDGKAIELPNALPQSPKRAAKAKGAAPNSTRTTAGLHDIRRELDVVALRMEHFVHEELAKHVTSLETLLTERLGKLAQHDGSSHSKTELSRLPTEEIPTADKRRGVTLNRASTGEGMRASCLLRPFPLKLPEKEDRRDGMISKFVRRRAFNSQMVTPRVSSRDLGPHDDDSEALTHGRLLEDPLEECDEVDMTIHEILTLLVQSRYWINSVSALVFLNIFAMGLQTEYNARVGINGNYYVLSIFRFVELCCLVGFLLEIVVRMFVAKQSDFWCGHESRQNIFDTIVVLLQLIDDTVPLIGGSVHISAVRLLRGIRIIRVFRIVRVLNLVTDLRVLVISVQSAFWPLFWAVVFLAFVTLSFAMLLTQVVTDAKVDAIALPGGFEGIEELDSLFGSVDRSLLMIYESVTGGVNWGELATPLMRFLSPWWGAAIAIFITFVVLGLVNVTTAVFMTSAIRVAEEDRKEILMHQMQGFFEEADEDKSGTIKLCEFEQNLDHPQLQAYLKQIDLHQDQARSLYDILDPDETDDVAIEDIVAGTVRLCGPAQAIDLAAVARSVEKAIRLLEELSCHTQMSLQTIMGRV